MIRILRSVMGKAPGRMTEKAEWLANSLSDTREILSGRAHRRMRDLRLLLGTVIGAESCACRAEDATDAAYRRLASVIFLVREGRGADIPIKDLVRLEDNLLHARSLNRLVVEQIRKIEVPE